jgi:hypothetical protein
MPYAPKFEAALHGIASGKWHPTEGSLRKIGKDKAAKMLAEAKRTGQGRALKEA